MASQINASNSGFGGIVSTGDSSGQLQLQTANTTAVTIDTSQNVGIGTSSPTSKLHVFGSTNSGSAAQIYAENSNSGSAVQVGLFTSNGSYTAQFSIAGTGYAGYGMYSANEALVYNANNINIMANSGSGVIKFATGGNTEKMRIDSSGSLLVGPSSSAATYPYNAINAVNYKRQLTSGTAQSVFTFTKTNTTASSSYRSSFMGTLYVAFTGRTSGGTTSAYGFTANVNIASTAGSTITLAASAVSALNAVSSGLTVSCAVSLTSASATSANLSVTITQTAGTLQDNELTVSLIGANSSTDSTSFFTVTPA